MIFYTDYVPIEYWPPDIATIIFQTTVILEVTSVYAYDISLKTSFWVEFTIFLNLWFEVYSNLEIKECSKKMRVSPIFL